MKKKSERYVTVNEYETRRRAAVEALVNFFIDTRGCSRLVAAGYAMVATKERYDEISENVNKP